MPDTGAAAGQQVEVSLRLRRNGTALVYANAAAFEAAGWALVYRAAQTAVALSYSLTPHPDATLAARGFYLVVFTLVNGQGPLLVDTPSGLGWQASPPGWQVGCEATDQDDTYSAILQSVGVAPAQSLITTTDFGWPDGDSFMRETTVLETAITRWGLTAENLADGTITLDCSVRRAANRVGIPDGWLSVTVVTATTGDNPVIRLSAIDFPSAQTGIQGGLDYGAVDVTDDAAIADEALDYDVQASFTKAIAITAVSTVNKTFTMASDQRRWFSKGGQFAVVGSTGNNGTYTCSALALVGGATVVTVVEVVASGVADGSTSQTVRFTLGDGTITHSDQETRT